jgi:lysophospholipase L1-like esterase
MNIELRKIMPGDSAGEVADAIYENDTDILNAVNNLTSQLYGGNIDDSSPADYEEIIPYNPNTNYQSFTNNTLIYNNQQTIQGKYIHAIKLKISQAGVFTVLISTTKNGSNIVWTKSFTVSAGEQELILDQYLPEDQYLGFHLTSDTARFAWNNSSIENPVGGGFWFGNTYNTTNLCIGVIINRADVQEIDGDIPQLKAEIDAIKNGVSTQNTNYIALGDSITFGYGGVTPYPVLLGNRPSITLINNFAVSGKKVYGNDGLITEVNQVPDNFTGLITVMIGINDSNNNISLGDTGVVLAKNFNDLSATVSFAEAFRLNIETLLRKDPSAKVLVILPLKAGTGVGLSRIEQYRQVERDICEYFAVPYAEIYKTCGISPLTYSALLPDNLHPNDAGNVSIEHALWPVVRLLIE